MSTLFQELAHAETRMGRLSLRRRKDLLLGGIEVFEVKLGDEFLMSSLFHEAETSLGHLGLAASPYKENDVLIGGLGLGYTAAAVLEHENAMRSMVVADALADVIQWHQQGLVPLGHSLSAHEKVKLQHADFFRLVGPETGQKFHVILLDIDHSPGHHLNESHAAFYSFKGLTNLTFHLHPGGVFAMWSNDQPDNSFLSLLRQVFTKAEARVIDFDNPYTGQKTFASIYLAYYSA